MRRNSFSLFFPGLRAITLLTLALLGSNRALADDTIYLYLAGPGVFLEEAVAYGEARKARIRELAAAHSWPVAVEGLYPLDNSIDDFAPDRATGLRIYRANMKQIARADAVVANMVRFRSPSMDVGTAFEMGVGRGMGKGVFGYYDAVPFYGSADYGEGSGAFELPSYAERVGDFLGVPETPARDADGLTVEDFAMTDNLMLLGALDDGGTRIASTFDEAVINAVSHVLRERAGQR